MYSSLPKFPSIHADPDQARQTPQNSGGVAEGQPRFDKGGGGGGVAIFFFTFYAIKYHFLEFLAKRLKMAYF